jgi:uncharacterized protein (TIGR02246 family)
MKSTYAVILCILLLQVSACAQKVNDPAEVEAIKQLVDEYAKAMNAGDADGAVAMMSDQAIFADNHFPVSAGKEAIRSLFQVFLGQFKFDLSLIIEDVRVAGSLAVARGTYALKLTPEATGIAPISEGGSGMMAFSRQNDGVWKWDWTVVNSNQPLPGATADGVEEKALIQVEQDSVNALLKSDVAAFERLLAEEWTSSDNGQVMGKAQMLAALKSGSYKIESMLLSDLSTHVFGDVAVVTATAVMKGTYKGIDISGPHRGADFFVKRDGRWQLVSTQATMVK